ncbi:hypothetical protein B0F90DRAFT_1670838 [Multifurca ochricompacta]|uniref:Uncharacterized protein n=1 Tax=Multifurca ochricompacta TaxID=376703 RepID=A0AAD4LXD9_9AGAM|nr:hypothetical protein B0F90DRAFT_1670838 [Multifurca ochricompacta]
MAINNDMAALAGFACETFFYGCYTTLFALSIFLMAKYSRGRTSFNRPIFMISIFLYLACSAHFALEFSHFYDVLATTGVNGFANETSVLVGADILISVTDFLGQVILIYRCWLLWSKNYWVIVLPSLTSIGGLACVAELVDLLLHINPSSPMAPSTLVPLGLAGFILPLCTNVLVTGLIATRIWYLSPRRTRDLRGLHFPSGIGRAAIDIVVESGALYLVVQLIFVVLFAMQHPAQGIVGVIAVQIYGIAPALIIIRVALGLSHTPTSRPGCGAAASSPTQVYFGYATSSFTDAGQHRQQLPVGIPMVQIKPESRSDDRASSFGFNENV